MPDFAAVLKRHRLAAGLSQEELSERASLSRDAVSTLERGVRRAPYRDTVALLADALGLLGAARDEFEQVAGEGRRRKLRQQTPAAANGNLVLPTTSFIGRETELTDLARLLERRRWVTITGPGGIGKTRLALELAARAWVGREVWLVDLSVVDEHRTVVAQLAGVLGLPDMSPGDAIASIIYACAGKRVFMILDNCERVLLQTSELVAALLSGDADVHILVTSRERLGLYGEVVYALTSLALPPAEPKSSEEALRFAAVQLFVERTGASDRRFAIVDRNAAAIADICRRLDGIPLALELAAARVPSVGVVALRDRLKAHLEALAGGGSDRPSRHRTMMATIAWSYELLQAGERALFRRLATFSGGWTLQAAEHACAGDIVPIDAVFEQLSSLVDKSLVQMEPLDDDARYRFFDSTRTFAYDELLRSGEAELTARRHALWMADFADTIASSFTGDIRVAWRAPFERELDNARAALSWALAPDGDAAVAGRIAGGLRVAWLRTGLVRELRAWTEAVLQRLDDSREPRVVAQLYRGLLQATEGRDLLDVARRALPIFERANDRGNLLLVYITLIFDRIITGHLDEAWRASASAEELVGALDEHAGERIVYLLAAAWLNANQGRGAEARRLVDAVLGANGAALGAEPTALAASTLALVEFNAGNFERSAVIIEEVLNARPAWSNPTQAFALLFYLSGYYVAARRKEEARHTVIDALELATLQPSHSVFRILHPAAAALASQGDAATAARLLGHIDAWAQREGILAGVQPEQFCRDLVNDALVTMLTPQRRAEIAAEGAAQSDVAILVAARAALTAIG